MHADMPSQDQALVRVYVLQHQVKVQVYRAPGEQPARELSLRSREAAAFVAMVEVNWRFPQWTHMHTADLVATMGTDEQDPKKANSELRKAFSIGAQTGDSWPEDLLKVLDVDGPRDSHLTGKSGEILRLRNVERWWVDLYEAERCLFNHLNLGVDGALDDAWTLLEDATQGNLYRTVGRRSGLRTSEQRLMNGVTLLRELARSERELKALRAEQLALKHAAMELRAPSERQADPSGGSQREAHEAHADPNGAQQAAAPPQQASEGLASDGQPGAAAKRPHWNQTAAAAALFMMLGIWLGRAFTPDPAPVEPTPPAAAQRPEALVGQLFEGGNLPGGVAFESLFEDGLLLNPSASERGASAGPHPACQQLEGKWRLKLDPSLTPPRGYDLPAEKTSRYAALDALAYLWCARLPSMEGAALGSDEPSAGGSPEPGDYAFSVFGLEYLINGFADGAAQERRIYAGLETIYFDHLVFRHCSLDEPGCFKACEARDSSCPQVPGGGLKATREGHRVERRTPEALNDTDRGNALLALSPSRKAYPPQALVVPNCDTTVQLGATPTVEFDCVPLTDGKLRPDLSYTKSLTRVCDWGQISTPASHSCERVGLSAKRALGAQWVDAPTP